MDPYTQELARELIELLEDGLPDSGSRRFVDGQRFRELAAELAPLLDEDPTPLPLPGAPDETAAPRRVSPRLVRILRSCQQQILEGNGKPVGLGFLCMAAALVVPHLGVLEDLFGPAAAALSGWGTSAALFCVASVTTIALSQWYVLRALRHARPDLECEFARDGWSWAEVRDALTDHPELRVFRGWMDRCPPPADRHADWPRQSDDGACQSR